eukprot:GHVT01074579.1.p1 GENE.GHVT01074579.1~~GHVT01074579.1.p1  ORF type:complete len:158 (-),score=11.16 GHVT01074579.1:772-1245(-)
MYGRGMIRLPGQQRGLLLTGSSRRRSRTHDASSKRYTMRPSQLSRKPTAAAPSYSWTVANSEMQPKGQNSRQFGTAAMGRALAAQRLVGQRIELSSGAALRVAKSGGGVLEVLNRCHPSHLFLFDEFRFGGPTCALCPTILSTKELTIPVLHLQRQV